MTLPIRIPPIVERWDCHGCGACCRAKIIPLGDADLRKLDQQNWQQHPDYSGARIVVRLGRFKKGYRLAHRDDGNCVFLTAEGRCRIHEEYGAEAKPLLCRLYPFQLVPLEKFAYLTLRRNCPSAAADRGRSVEEHLGEAVELARQRQPEIEAARPPMIVPGHRRTWQDAFRVLEAIERLMTDSRYPPVRRLVHALQLCDLLGQCRLRGFPSSRLGPLLDMLEASAVKESARWFAVRRPPGRAGGMLFRQATLEYVRLHPKFVIRESWRERWRLIVAAMAFARGRGRMPRLHPSFPATTFEALERPLGALGQDELRPLTAYFEAVVASRRYAALDRNRWSIVESFRATALAYPVATWLLRLACGDRPIEVDDVIDVVGAIDRGQGYAPLSGLRHRRRVASLARMNELARLVAWYGR